MNEFIPTSKDVITTLEDLAEARTRGAPFTRKNRSKQHRVMRWLQKNRAVVALQENKRSVFWGVTPIGETLYKRMTGHHLEA